MDIVVANHTPDTVSVLLGKGDGTFLAMVDSAAGTGPFALAMGDLNGDGKHDAVVTNFYYESSTMVSVLLAAGDGRLGPGQGYRAGNGPNSVAVGDLNDDGKLDIVITNQWFVGTTVLLGNGDGTFRGGGGYAVGREPNSVALGDLNGDGKLDIVTASGTLSLLLGAGDGTFAAKVEYAAGSGSVALGDLNGDGRLDIVAGTRVLLNACQ